MDADVHIGYWLTRELDEHTFERALDILSVEERARHAKLAFADDRRDFAAAHLLLRQTLSEHGPRHARDWVFVHGRNGKPGLAHRDDGQPDLSFNLTHTRGLVACVVAHGVDVGIDVERIDDAVDSLDIARRHFQPAEVADVERCRGDERGTRFAELWTLKEAYVKATGDGLSGGLDEYAFTFEGRTALRCDRGDRTLAGAWKFALFKVSDYRLAVAVKDAAQGVGTFRMTRHDGGTDDVKDEVRLLRSSWGLSRTG